MQTVHITDASLIHPCCSLEVPLSSIPDLLETLGLTELTSLLGSVGLSSEVLASDSNNFTVFAPSNEVLAKFVLPALQRHGVRYCRFGF